MTGAEKIRKVFWKKVTKAWLNGDYKIVAKMICLVVKKNPTARDVNAVGKFIVQYL